MKRFFLPVLTLFVALFSCSGEAAQPPQPAPPPESALSDVVKITSDLCIDIHTDKALYAPGDVVTFMINNVLQNCQVRYRSAGKVVRQHPLDDKTWTWKTPSDDFVGYMVEIFRNVNADEEKIYATIAVDVSSDWTRFPRYGFVSDYGAEKLADGVIDKEMAFLNRCHINGIQFYDWHDKHHAPLALVDGRQPDTYKDIANRVICTSVIKKYIDVQHRYGMKSLFYNLCFGVLEDAASDGVAQEWRLFRHRDRTGDVFLHLPDNWKSDIYLVNPGNADWQNFLAEKNSEVYSHFDFDGFHVDQLGNWGTLYDWSGNPVSLPEGYASFLRRMKEVHPDKCLVMNAVSGFGGKQIAETASTEFLYNEVWQDQDEFVDLYDIIKTNDKCSNYRQKTVFAAYMNYGCSGRDFNIPGVLLTDAVIFAIGGAHLELGDHMLCREYFPSREVKMDVALQRQIVVYYDFLTAYQQLLRGADSRMTRQYELNPLGTSNVKFSQWPPRSGTVTLFAKQSQGKHVLHFLNFVSADNTSWRDLNGTMPQPRTLSKLKVKIPLDHPIHRVWMASPDYHGGAFQPIPYASVEGGVLLELPFLKYWDMVVIE